jgi:hypothetical protein
LSTGGARIPIGEGQSGGGGEDEGDQAGGGGDAASEEGGEGGAGGAGDDLFGDGESFGRGGSGTEDALEESLEDFDEAFGREQEALARAGGGSAADETLERAGGAPDGERAGSGPGGNQTVAGSPDEPDPRLIPGRNGPGVEGCDDTDLVARQLCELATREEDPFLRADLWDEYNEYLAILRGR